MPFLQKHKIDISITKTSCKRFFTGNPIIFTQKKAHFRRPKVGAIILWRRGWLDNHTLFGEPAIRN
jgi:hypothetical protein